LDCTILQQQATFFVFFATATRAWCISPDLCHREDVSKAWKDAKLNHCPLHPQGGCKFAGHGTYSRKFPDGVKVARWYCPSGHTTFSMLPDCLSSRLPGTLIEVETVINQIESSPSQEAAANNIRLDISLPGALRWMRRRLFLVRSVLILLIELLPSLPGNYQPTLSSFRSVLGIEFTTTFRLWPPP